MHVQYVIVQIMRTTHYKLTYDLYIMYKYKHHSKKRSQNDIQIITNNSQKQDISTTIKFIIIFLEYNLILHSYLFI